MKKTYFDISITRTLLDRKESELTDLEKEAISHYKERVSMRDNRLSEANSEIRKNCPILCSGYDYCFIPSYGWIEPITDFCYQLEALNIQYAKYGVKVTSSQNKEKYGTYRCYYDINGVPCGLFKYPIAFCGFISDTLDKLNYGPKWIEDECPKVTIEWEEITKEEFDNRKVDSDFRNRECKLSWNDDFSILPFDKTWKNLNGEEKHETVYQIHYKDSESKDVVVDFEKDIVFREKNGRFYIAYELHHGPKNHVEYTRYRILKKIDVLFRKLEFFLTSHNIKPRKNAVMRNDMAVKVEKLYSECEKECQKRCEICGYQIGDDISPECVTHGWISYVCEDCAIASGSEYTKDGKTWKEGNLEEIQLRNH